MKFWYQKRFCDILKSSIWHHKIEFVISQIHVYLVVSNIDFVISQNNVVQTKMVVDGLILYILWHHKFIFILWSQN